MRAKSLLVTGLLLAMMSSGQTPASADGVTSQAPRFEGTWDVVNTFSDNSAVKSVLTVIPGAREGEGSIIHSSALSLAPPNPTVPEQGAWRRSGRRHFVASYRGFSFTETLQPFGQIGFRHGLTLSKNGDTFSGQAVFEVLDGDGNVLFSDIVQTSGVRQQVLQP